MDINNHKQLVVTSNKEADKIKQFHNYNNERSARTEARRWCWFGLREL